MGMIVLAVLISASLMPATISRVEQSRNTRDALTSGRIRTLTKEAESRARNDPNELILALDKRVRELWGDFESFPVSIVRREDITIMLTTPFMGYRRALAEYLRMRRAVSEVPWVDAVTITVTVDRVNAPDIVEILVERDGKPITPARSTFKPMTFSDGNNRSAVLHAGDVFFPTSAFASAGPSTSVTVIAVPARGDRITFSIDNDQLQTLK